MCAVPPMQGMAPALEVEHLTVEIGGKLIVRDLSFQVPQGSSLLVIGPNGAGKTVLFRTLIGALPHQGTVRWAPESRLGYVPQKLDLERDLPIRGVDVLRAKAAVVRVGEEAIPKALEEVGLGPDLVRGTIASLSGGQFQRLLIASALLGDPNVLLLDEPTAGVDEPGQARVYEILQRLQKEQCVTVLMISHDLSVVFRYADQVLCLSRERAWFGPPREILTPELLQEVYRAPVRFHVHEPR